MDAINRIMDVLNTIEYGFKDNNGNNIINDTEKWDNEFNDFYYLQEPDELLNSKCGVCWDQVELERKLFSDAGIDTKSYFIFLVDGDNLPSHTFLLYKINNKFCWFEHSWGKYVGIHEYSNESELLNDIKDKFMSEHNYVSNSTPLYIYEYDKPKKHIKCDEFYKYIETQKRIEL